MSGSYGGYRNSVSKERRTIEFGKADTRKQAICERKFSGIGTVVLRLPLPLNLPNSRSGFLCEMYENHLSVTVECRYPDFSRKVGSDFRRTIGGLQTPKLRLILPTSKRPDSFLFTSYKRYDIPPILWWVQHVISLNIRYYLRQLSLPTSVTLILWNIG